MTRLIRSIYDEHIPYPGEVFTEPTLTQQHFRSECDVNNIMRKYAETGIFPVSDKPFEYGDFSADFDYQEAQNFLIDAQSRFDSLPADVRKRFDNNPAELLAFLDDSRNIDEAVKLGLVEKRADEPATPAEINLPPPVPAESLPN